MSKNIEKTDTKKTIKVEKNADKKKENYSKTKSICKC